VPLPRLWPSVSLSASVRRCWSFGRPVLGEASEDCGWTSLREACGTCRRTRHPRRLCDRRHCGRRSRLLQPHRSTARRVGCRTGRSRSRPRPGRSGRAWWRPHRASRGCRHARRSPDPAAPTARLRGRRRIPLSRGDAGGATSVGESKVEDRGRASDRDIADEGHRRRGSGLARDAPASQATGFLDDQRQLSAISSLMTTADRLPASSTALIPVGGPSLERSGRS